jgi:multiple sugar transport system permease protein
MKIKSVKNIFVYLLIIVLIFVLLSPIIYILISSFKSLFELITGGTNILPQKPTLQNYVTLLKVRTPVRDFPKFLWNSLKVSIGTTIATIIIASLGGYGFARFKYKGGNILGQLMLFIYVFPTVLLLIPIYRTYQFLKLQDTIIGLVIIYTALIAPFCTWLITSFFKTIPIELEESASIDGANRFYTLLRITLPLAAPGIVTIGTYSFIFGWCEYMFASILLTTSINKTAPLGLATLTAEQYIEWGPLLAGSMLIIIPVIILFFPVSKQFIKGFIAGALKE